MENLAFDYVQVLIIFDYIGVFVFAISGAILGIRRRMDIFGMGVLATATAIGGGTLRDIILGRDVFWLTNPEYIGLIIVATLLVEILSDKNKDNLKLIIWADALGLSVFTAIGASVAIEMGYGSVISIIMATITASFGGVIRDVLANRTPMIFLPQEFYATATVLGGIIYNASIYYTTANISLIITVLFTFLMRGLAIIYDWKSPVAHKEKK